jgi:hypothetical protein
VIIVPTCAPGVKLLCRVSNEYRAAALGSPDKLAHPDWSDASMPECFWVNHEMPW